MSTLAEYVQANGGRFENELFEFLRIPSVSTLPEHRPDMARAAAFVAGLENVEVIENAAGRPLAYGGLLRAWGKPAIPATAAAKVSARLAPNQDPGKILATARFLELLRA